jgi:hypothetical protein
MDFVYYDWFKKRKKKRIKVVQEEEEPVKAKKRSKSLSPRSWSIKK